MKHVKKSVLLWYSPHEMYQLVTDVEDVPAVPAVVRAGRGAARDDAEGLTARLHLAYAGVRHAFTTRNVHVPDESVHHRARRRAVLAARRHVAVRPLPLPRVRRALRRGPARSSSSCAMRSRARRLEAAISPVFDRIANTFVDSFVQARRAGLWAALTHGARRMRVAVACSPTPAAPFELTLELAGAGDALDALARQRPARAPSRARRSASGDRRLGAACAPEHRAARRRPGRDLSAAADGSERGAAAARRGSCALARRAADAAPLLAVGRDDFLGAARSRRRAACRRGSRARRSWRWCGARRMPLFERRHLRAWRGCSSRPSPRRSRSSLGLVLGGRSASAFLRFASSSGSAVRGARGLRGRGRRGRRRAAARRWPACGRRVDALGRARMSASARSRAAAAGRCTGRGRPCRATSIAPSAGRAIRLAATRASRATRRIGPWSRSTT